MGSSSFWLGLSYAALESIKIQLLLAHWAMNGLLLGVHVGMQPSTACDDKTDQLRNLLLTLLWCDEHPCKKVSYSIQSNVSGGFPCSEGYENKEFCGQSTQQARGPPGLPRPPISLIKGGHRAHQAPKSAHSLALQSDLQLASPVGSFHFPRDRDNPDQLSPICSTTSDPWTLPLPFPSSGPKSHYIFPEFKGFFLKHRDSNLSSEPTPVMPLGGVSIHCHGWTLQIVTPLHHCPLFSWLLLLITYILTASPSVHMLHLVTSDSPAYFCATFTPLSFSLHALHACVTANSSINSTLATRGLKANSTRKVKEDLPSKSAL